MNLIQVTIISATVGKIPWKKWSSPHNQQKSLRCSTGLQPKNGRMISVLFQDKPFNYTVIHVYTPTTDAKEAEVDQFYEDLEDLLELKPKK